MIIIAVCIFLYSLGLQEIQLLTKQSMRTKPFCLASGKQWTLSPTATDLREIYTDLSWTRIRRQFLGGATQNRLKNITQILSDDRLGEDGPVRILVKGNPWVKSLSDENLVVNDKKNQMYVPRIHT